MNKYLKISRKAAVLVARKGWNVSARLANIATFAALGLLAVSYSADLRSTLSAQLNTGYAGIIGTSASGFATLTSATGSPVLYQAEEKVLVTHLYPQGTQVRLSNPANGRSLDLTVTADQPTYLLNTRKNAAPTARNGMVAHISPAVATAIGFSGNPDEPLVLRTRDQTNPLNQLAAVLPLSWLQPQDLKRSTPSQEEVTALAMNATGECGKLCNTYGRLAVTESVLVRQKVNFNGRTWKKAKDIVFANIPGRKVKEYSWAQEKAHVAAIRNRVETTKAGRMYQQEVTRRLTDRLEPEEVALTYTLACASMYHAPEAMATPRDRKRMGYRAVPMSVLQAKLLRHEYWQTCDYLPGHAPMLMMVSN